MREKRGARQAVRGPVVLAAATGPGPRGPGCVRREPSLARPRHHGAQPCRGSGSSRSLSSLLLLLPVSVLWLVCFPALWGSSRRRWAPLGVTREHLLDAVLAFGGAGSRVEVHDPQRAPELWAPGEPE